jgi:cytochrome P450
MSPEPRCATMDEAEQPGEARFDSALGAWVLTSYADVSAALRDPRLSVSGVNADGDAAHVAVREAAAHVLAPARLATWRAEVEASARVLAERLPVGVPVDLVGAFARPWSVTLAVQATGVPPADAERLDRLA